jgi:hypothetical protein
MRRTLVAATAAFFIGCAANHAYAEHQPRMHDALAQLQGALSSLKAASSDKGGHRAKAIELTQAAIDEVKTGIQFDNKH